MGTGSLAGILASGRAPAYAQTQTMHWLRWSDFVPASDVFLKGEIVKLCEKDLGMKLTVETINANDIQARITAAIQSGSGPDIFMTVISGRNFMRTVALTSATSPKSWTRHRVASTTPARSSGPSAASGSACPGAPAAASSPTASPGSPKRVHRNFPKPGTRTPRRRQEAEGGRPSLRPDRRSHLRRRAGLVKPVLWSWGGEGS